MTVVDSVVYVDGKRTEVGQSPARTVAALRGDAEPGEHRFCWIGLLRPSAEEVGELAEAFALHPLAVEDTVDAHQRPKLERYGDVDFVVLRPARYVDEHDLVTLGEIHLFLGPDFVITVRHADEPDLGRVRSRLEADPELLARGPWSVFYGVLDQIVDDYVPVLTGLQDDIDEIEVAVFDGDTAASRRIYQLSREIIDFQRAVAPLTEMITELRGRFKSEGTDDDLELRRALRDVADHAVKTADRTEAYRLLLVNILQTNAALVAQRQNDEMARVTEAGYAQNEQMKKVSSWAAIGFAPSLVAGVYGMNFQYMPELGWVFGYPMALLLMVLVATALYTTFKRNDWL